ncbi:MAG: DUF5615 family PIN-like protein, partial [Acidobacteria bacterium]|nr:DUF5615 family PIN-like protein [Acidobacteriota bacterium]
MRLLADECPEREIVDGLRADGHQVFAVRERLPGSNDGDVLAVSLSRDEVLVTHDKDFGELVVRDGEASAGVILLRLPRMTPDERALRLVEWLRVHGAEIAGRFVVLSTET